MYIVQKPTIEFEQQSMYPGTGHAIIARQNSHTTRKKITIILGKKLLHICSFRSTFKLEKFLS